MDKFLKDTVANQLAFLFRQLENVEKSFLKKRPIPEKWSIKEHLAHLGRYQEIFLGRLTVILKKETPHLERYKAENDFVFYDWCALTITEISQKAVTKRLEILQLINQLTEEQIQQIGVHPKLGRMNVEDWTRFFILHEAHHIYAIFGLKQRFYITEN